MSNIFYLNSYKLKEGVSTLDFSLEVERFFSELIKLKGVISLALLVDGETWIDYAVFETMDVVTDLAKSLREARESGSYNISEKFYSFLDLNSIRSHRFYVEGEFTPIGEVVISVNTTKSE